MSESELEIVVGRSHRAGRRFPRSPRPHRRRCRIDPAAGARVALGYDNWRTASAGIRPARSRLFPFYLSVILAGASLYGLVTAYLSRQEASDTFVTERSFAGHGRVSCRRYCSAW